MAPRTTGELAGGMALGGHIRRKNYEFTSVKGPAPTTACGYDPNLCHRDPGHVACSGCALRTTSGGSILEFTYPEGPVPSLTVSHGWASHSGSQMSMAHGDLTQGMAHGGHIPCGNHEIARTYGATPIIRSYPV